MGIRISQLESATEYLSRFTEMYFVIDLGGENPTLKISGAELLDKLGIVVQDPTFQTLKVTGQSIFEALATFQDIGVEGDADIEGSLEVVGESFFQALATFLNIAITNNATVGGTLTASTIQSPNYQSELVPKGIKIYEDEDGRGIIVCNKIEAEELMVDTLTYNETTAVGAEIVSSSAWSTVSRIEVNDDGEYIFYYKPDDGLSMWEVADQPRMVKGGRYFWGLIKEVTSTISDDGEYSFTCSMLDGNYQGDPANVIVGDKFVLYGNRGSDKTRQTITVLSSGTTENPYPSIDTYYNITSFNLSNLEDKKTVSLSYNSTLGVKGARIKLLTDEKEIYFLGDKIYTQRDEESTPTPMVQEMGAYVTGETYFANQRVTLPKGTLYLCTAPNGTTDYPSILSGDWMRQSTDYDSDLSELQSAVDTAQQTANDAQADATSAIGDIAVITSDGVLTPAEKATERTRLAGITAEKSENIAQASRYSVPSATYANAYAALNTYLTTVALIGTAIDTEIDRNTYDTYYDTYYTTRQALLEAIADAAQGYVGEVVDAVQIGGVNLLDGSADVKVWVNRLLFSDLVVGQTYTMTVGSIAGTESLYKAINYNYDTSTTHFSHSYPPNGGSWTFVAGAPSIVIYAANGYMPNVVANWYEVMLVKGNKAIEGWQPSENDRNEAIADAKQAGLTAQGQATTVQNNLNNVNSNLTTAISDGNIDVTEKAKIIGGRDAFADSYNSLIASWTELNSNPYLSGSDALSALNTAKANLGTAYTSLNGAITNVANATNRTALNAAVTAYNAAFTTYNTASNAFNTALAAVNKAIADGAVDARVSNIYLRGTGYNNNATPLIKVNNVSVLPASGRGLMLMTIHRTTLVATYIGSYDTYGGVNDTMVAALDTISSDFFVAIVSYDAIGSSSLSLFTTLEQFGYANTATFGTDRIPFAFIGYKGLAKGYGISMISGSDSTSAYAEINAYVANGVFSNSNSYVDAINAVQTSANDAIAQALVDSKDYTDDAKTTINNLISDLESSKADLSNVYTKAQADGIIDVVEQNVLNVQSVATQAQTDLLNVYTKAQADGVIDDAEQRAITAAQQKANAAQQAATEAAQGMINNITPTYVWIDATALDENTFYPVIFKNLSTAEKTTIKIKTGLSSYYGSPSWATHGSTGFTACATWSVFGSGWGTREIERLVLEYDLRFTSVSSVIGSIGQMTNSSTECIYVRGGAKYEVAAYTAYGNISSSNIALVTSSYTAQYQTISTLTSITVPVTQTRAISTAQSTANSKSATFTQASMPTSAAKNDTWYNTDTLIVYTCNTTYTSGGSMGNWTPIADDTAHSITTGIVGSTGGFYMATVGSTVETMKANAYAGLKWALETASTYVNKTVFWGGMALSNVNTFCTQLVNAINTPGAANLTENGTVITVDGSIFTNKLFALGAKIKNLISENGVFTNATVSGGVTMDRLTINMKTLTTAQTINPDETSFIEGRNNVTYTILTPTVRGTTLKIFNFAGFMGLTSAPPTYIFNDRYLYAGSYSFIPETIPLTVSSEGVGWMEAVWIGTAWLLTQHDGIVGANYPQYSFNGYYTKSMGEGNVLAGVFCVVKISCTSSVVSMTQKWTRLSTTPTVSKVSTGEYRITHGKGDTNYTAIGIGEDYNSTIACVKISIHTISATSCTIAVSDDATVNDGGFTLFLIDTSVYF